jgi:CheY-like chemotaxis protein
MGLLVQASLESYGYSVKVVDSGFAALDAASQEHFDAVVLDVEMPGLDGLAVGRALRNHPKTRAAMIAMHTSVDEAAVRSGFDQYDAYLPKPSSPERIGECVHRLVQDGRNEAASSSRG